MNNRIWLWPGETEGFRPSLTQFDAGNDRSAVIVCPGGGYTMKAPHEGEPIAEMLVAAGITAFVLDYHVFPCQYDAPLMDALRAIRMVRSLGYERVGIMGFSAGGHLTCSAATLNTPGDPESDDPVERYSSQPDVFIPCYAVVSLAAYRHQGSIEALLGDKAQDWALIRRFSAELQVNSDTPPAFIWHTAADDLVPVEQSLQLAQALSHAMIPYELHIFPEGHHGLGLAENVPAVCEWPRLLTDWLRRQGF